MTKIITHKHQIEGKSDENEGNYKLTEKPILSIPNSENISDKELLEIRDSLHQFALILYEFISQEQLNMNK